MANLSTREKLQIDASDLALRRSWLDLTDEDLELISATKEFLEPVAEEIVKKFYDFGYQFREFTQVVDRSGSNRQILEGAQKAYFLQALDGKIDSNYVDRRLTIGARHADLNILPRWNMGAYALYFSLVFPYFFEHLEGETLQKTCIAWSKILLFDVTLAIEGYISEGVLSSMINASGTIGTASGELTEGASQVDKAAQEIATAIQEIAAGSTKQTEAMNTTTEQMKELGGAIEEVAQAAEKTSITSEEGAKITNEVAEAIVGISTDATAASELAEKAREGAQAGATSVGKTVQGLEAIRDAVNNAATQVEELGKRGDEIGGIVETIDDVASQTNLLALNAAIEAARAGEQGRGFAVVADNVRALAERAAESSKEISKLVASVQAGVRETVQAMQAGVADVEKGMEVAGEAGEAMQEIVSNNEQLSEGIGRINESATTIEGQSKQLQEAMQDLTGVAQQLKASSDTMAESSDKVGQAVQEASAQAEQAAASSQEVSASVEEVTAQIGEINAKATGLSEQVEVLDQIALKVLESEERVSLYRNESAEEKKAA